jgi:hypothetical protein
MTRLQKKEWAGLLLVMSCWLLGQPMGAAAQAKGWQEKKGEHFIVYYLDSADAVFVSALLRKAEEYYRRVAQQIGYTRYTEFWTWDDRVKIILFPDKGSFLTQTGLPAWSNGFSDRDSAVFRSRVIGTYRQEQDFLDGLLPHEISHLVLKDVIPPGNLPVWFDEGVAQLQERDKKNYSWAMVRSASQQGRLLPLAALLYRDVRKETDTATARIFYSQSLAVVDFLLTKYGMDDFRRLCQDLRGGKNFSEALVHVYGTQFRSIDDLERKWLAYLQQAK